MKPVLVVATNNAHKLRELSTLLADLPVSVRSVREVLGRDVPVEEDGLTFDDNATKKAETIAKMTMLLTLADDSGLEVDALNGAPGVYSARFAGVGATDADNNALLVSRLAALQTTNSPPFSARFRCVLALTDPLASVSPPAFPARGGASLATLLVNGRCEGSITDSARGDHGFGYDPIFLVGQTGRTLAEHNDHEKHAISHRGDAFRKLRLVLEKVLLARSERVAHLTHAAG